MRSGLGLAMALAALGVSTLPQSSIALPPFEPAAKEPKVRRPPSAKRLRNRKRRGWR